MADIIYNDFDEEWISLDGKSFYDGDIHSQLARAYAYALETAYGVSASGSVYLYDLTSTPHPAASDVVDNDQDMGRIVKFLATIYSNLMDLLKSQPYTPYGETDSWYWGEPGTEASPTPLDVPDDFFTLASPLAILGGLLDADKMPQVFSLREEWHNTISTIRATLEKMTFIYKNTTSNLIRVDHYASAYNFSFIGDGYGYHTSITKPTAAYQVIGSHVLKYTPGQDLYGYVGYDRLSGFWDRGDDLEYIDPAYRIIFKAEGSWDPGVIYYTYLYRQGTHPELLGSYELTEASPVVITCADFCGIPVEFYWKAPTDEPPGITSWFRSWGSFSGGNDTMTLLIRDTPL